jgi:hypothetical protein
MSRASVVVTLEYMASVDEQQGSDHIDKPDVH